LAERPTSETFGVNLLSCYEVSLFFVKQGDLVTTYIASAVFVVLAEMGDKTQLLAMAFASRYRWQTVMWGVFVATLANHLLAVLCGCYLTRVIPIHYIQIAASTSFIMFGLWTLKGDTLQNEDKRFNFSPFWTVAVAFFIAEMGDKTQLATVALATRYESIIQIWLGTTTGMIIADAVGIIAGVVLGKKIPERFIKWFAAIIFIGFGFFGLYQVLPTDLWTPPVIAASIGLVSLLVLLVVRLSGDPTTRNDSQVPG
jgi:putative Ca2+/H+ antiporter (TMEM165/GDT1 family)